MDTTIKKVISNGFEFEVSRDGKIVYNGRTLEMKRLTANSKKGCPRRLYGMGFRFKVNRKDITFNAAKLTALAFMPGYTENLIIKYKDGDPSNYLVDNLVCLELSKNNNIEGEEWRDVRGYEGYEVSNMGRVRTKTRTVKTTRGSKHIMGKVMTPIPDRKGYFIIDIRIGGERKLKALVHRLVAEAFIPNPNNLPQINHKDENKANNHAENLEWCTCLYNLKYSNVFERAALFTSKAVEQLSEDMQVLDEFPSASKAGKALGINGNNINACCRGKAGSCGGFRWRYKDETLRVPMNMKFAFKHVVQMDMEGNEIKTFPSTKIAAESVGCFPQSITACCKGKIKYTGGFKWKYAYNNI